MGRALVTGATGFLGRNLVEELSHRGWKTTALVRNAKSAQAQALAKIPNVTVAAGDILIARTILEAISDGVDVVFHCAADTSTWKGHRQRQHEVNVDGTRNIIYATYESQAKVLVHVSTASVWGDQKALPYDETTRKLGHRSFSGYVRSKLAAEHAVLRAVDRGLEAVIVNPGHIMGPHDTHNWATLIKMVNAGKLPGIPPGSGCFAHAPQLAKTLIRAAEVGKSGENYLLGGPHATFEDLVTRIAEQLGAQLPAGVKSAAMLDLMGRWNNLKSMVTRRPPRGMTREAAWFVSHNDSFSSEKAMKQLGYAPTALPELLSDAINWQKASGALQPRAGAAPAAQPLGDQSASADQAKPAVDAPPMEQTAGPEHQKSPGTADHAAKGGPSVSRDQPASAVMPEFVRKTG